MRTCRKCGITSDCIRFAREKTYTRNECIACYRERRTEAERIRYERDHDRIRLVKVAYKRKNRKRINRMERERYRRNKALSPLSYRSDGASTTKVGRLRNFNFDFTSR